MLSLQQKSAINEVADWHKSGQEQIFRLFGFAGTGKSFIAKNFARQIKGRVSYAAYTGKASIVMEKSGCFGASTIHSLIYNIKQNPVTGEIKFNLDKGGVASQSSLIVIDECSMVDGGIGQDLTSFNVPILVLGDPAQLPPVVKGGGFFTDQDPDVMLTEIHRQAENNPIIKLATDVRQGKKLDFGNYGKSKVISKMDITKEEVLAADQVLVGLNKSRHNYNERIRSLLGRESDLPQIEDRIVCLKNDRNLNIFNGGIFTVLGIKTSKVYPKIISLLVKSDDFPNRAAFYVEVRKEFFLGGIDNIHWKDLRKTQQFNFGYALTVHKCVSPETIVNTELGLKRIKDINNTGLIDTGYGLKPYNNKIKYINSETIKIKTEFNYELEVTKDHKIEVFDVNTGSWNLILAKDCNLGDWFRLCKKQIQTKQEKYELPLPLNGNSRELIFDIPKYLTPELSLFFGLMVADGTLFNRGFRLKKKDLKTCDIFKGLCESIFKCNPVKSNGIGCYGYEVCSTYISRWLKSMDFMNPKNKFIPDFILSSGEENTAAFLRGLFEDGYVNVKKDKVDHVSLFSSTPQIIKTTQQLLLNLGITSSVSNDCSAVSIYSQDILTFKNKIGFVCDMKNNRLNNNISESTKKRVPLSYDQIEVLNMRGYDRQASRYNNYISRSKLNYYNPKDERLDWEYVRVKSITNSKSDTYCVSVPSDGCFLQNGFRHGNSQGSQWGNVVLFDESSAFRDDWQRWLYTGITRASESITVVK